MIHILGIAGTFMAGIAALAREANITVSGSDSAVYPPMSSLLEALNIPISDYSQNNLLTDKTLIIGNAISRGNAMVEHILNHKLPYTSGPQWLYENVLYKKTVLAVAGTHGKTTTASMLAWILHDCSNPHPADANTTANAKLGSSTESSLKSNPGFLIGGKPGNFAHSAQLGNNPYFVIEADEYDTAFFDKRSKFVHYHPTITVLNNLEFDHADIFADIEAIKTQFHHLIRTLPENGKLIVNADDPQLAKLLQMGCWTPIERFSINNGLSQGIDWAAKANKPSACEFTVFHQQQSVAVKWQGMGEHNMSNALAAIAAAYQCGITVKDACRALENFIFPNKRLQKHPSKMGFILFEDFAHHPTAIAKTLATLRASFPDRRIIAALELRSNTMQMGAHGKAVNAALEKADAALIVNTANNAAMSEAKNTQIYPSAAACFSSLIQQIRSNDVLLVMSNGHFDGIVQKLADLQ